MSRLLMVIVLLLSLITACAAFATDSFVPPDSSSLSVPVPPSASPTYRPSCKPVGVVAHEWSRAMLRR